MDLPGGAGVHESVRTDARAVTRYFRLALHAPAQGNSVRFRSKRNFTVLYPRHDAYLRVRAMSDAHKAGPVPAWRLRCWSPGMA